MTNEMFSHILITVSRKDVEHGNTAVVATTFAKLATLSGGDLLSNQSKYAIAIDGYDQDSREVFQIPEIREWWRTLDNQFPCLLFFLTSDLLQRNIYVLCLLDTVHGRLKPELDSQKLFDFVVKKLNLIGRFCRVRGIDPKPLAREIASNYGMGIDTEAFYSELANFQPDYGLAMLEQYGAALDSITSFVDFSLPHISYAGDGKFTALVGIGIKNVTHALSLDYSVEQLGHMLGFTDNETAEAVFDWIRHGCLPTTFELDIPIHFPLSCKFGSIEQNGNERFVPLIACKVGSIAESKPSKDKKTNQITQMILEF